MRQTTSLRIPRSLPRLYDGQRDAYLDPAKATAGQWRQLLPRLQALAASNVRSIRTTGGNQ
jgi:hypothetical protein